MNVFQFAASAPSEWDYVTTDVTQSDPGTEWNSGAASLHNGVDSVRYGWSSGSVGSSLDVYILGGSSNWVFNNAETVTADSGTDWSSGFATLDNGTVAVLYSWESGSIGTALDVYTFGAGTWTFTGGTESITGDPGTDWTAGIAALNNGSDSIIYGWANGQVGSALNLFTFGGGSWNYAATETVTNDPGDTEWTTLTALSDGTNAFVYGAVPEPSSFGLISGILAVSLSLSRRRLSRNS
ncbi:MAG: hypothetical protein AAF065_05565 [Verrucomicrobiota bacterium]